jgi:hypothetical protein
MSFLRWFAVAGCSISAGVAVDDHAHCTTGSLRDVVGGLYWQSVDDEHRADRHRLGDELLEEAAAMGESYDFGDLLGRVVGFDVEVGAGLRASGVDVAALHRSGQVEVEFRLTACLPDLNLSNVRVPRKLGKQSESDGERGIPQRWGPRIVSAYGWRLVGVDEVRPVTPSLEGILAGNEFGDGGDCVVDGARFEITALKKAVDAWQLRFRIHLVPPIAESPATAGRRPAAECC